MGQSNIDNIFQLIAPIADRTPSTTRLGSDTPGFDDHLTQASTSVFDVARPPSRSDSTTSYSTADSIWSTPSYAPASGSPTPKPVESRSDRKDREPASSSTPTSSPSTETKSVEKAADRSDHDDRDLDSSTASDESGVAGAAQAAGTTAPVKNDATPKSDSGEHENKKDVAAAEFAAKQHAKRAAKGESKSAHVHSECEAAKDETATSPAVTEETLADGTADENAPTESTETDAAKGKPNSKPAHENAEHTASVVTATVKTEQVAEEARTAEGTDAEAVTADETAARTQSTSTEKTSAGAKRPTPGDETSTDDPQSETTSVDSDATQAAAKADATAVSKGVAANVAADTTSKGEAVTDPADQPGKSAAAKTESTTNPLDRATRGTTEVTRNNSSSKTDETTTRIDPSRFVTRVAKAFQTANERGGTVQLRLSPPELGAMKIQLTVKDGVMSASMETENAGARRALLEHLPALRDRLAEQNIRIEKFDVDVRQENTGGQANPHGSNQNPYQPQPEQTQPRRTSGGQQTSAEAPLPDSAPLTAKISSTQINLVV